MNIEEKSGWLESLVVDGEVVVVVVVVVGVVVVVVVVVVVDDWGTHESSLSHVSKSPKLLKVVRRLTPSNGLVD